MSDRTPASWTATAVVPASSQDLTVPVLSSQAARPLDPEECRPCCTFWVRKEITPAARLHASV